MFDKNSLTIIMPSGDTDVIATHVDDIDHAKTFVVGYVLRFDAGHDCGFIYVDNDGNEFSYVGSNFKNSKFVPI